MQTPPHHPIPDERRLWIVALAPAVLWAMQFLFGYLISEWGCGNEMTGTGFLGWSITTAAILAVTLLAEVLVVWSGFSAYRIREAETAGRAPGAAGCRSLMATAGIWLAVIFGLTILVTGLASLAVSGCV